MISVPMPDTGSFTSKSLLEVIRGVCTRVSFDAITGPGPTREKFVCAPDVNTVQQICREDDCERPEQGASCLVDGRWLNGDVVRMLFESCGGVTSAGRRRLPLNEVGEAHVCVLVDGQWSLANRLAQ